MAESKKHALPPRTSRNEHSPNGLNFLDQISKDKGIIVKDRRGRFRIVYEDDDDIDEYRSRVQSVVVDGKQFEEAAKLFLEGVKFQQEKRYPFSVTNKKMFKHVKSRKYREGNEFVNVNPKKDTPLYKHLRENSSVRLVKDIYTGFVHICKTQIMARFRCEEVEAMISLSEIAPKIYNMNRNDEEVSIHMELIKGTRLDDVAHFTLNEHLWPLCLHIFNELLLAIKELSMKDMSHGDIHTKNIILEITDQNKIKIRLIDYGDACGYTLQQLSNDIKSLVASLLALLTRNDFNPYEEDPEVWIKNNPNIWERYPKLWILLKRALEVGNLEDLNKLISYVSIIIGDREIAHENNLSEIASQFQKHYDPSDDLALAGLSIQNE